MPNLKYKDKIILASSLTVFSSFFVFYLLKTRYKSKKTDYWEAILVDPNSF